jgi:hypothetical protein
MVVLYSAPVKKKKTRVSVKDDSQFEAEQTTSE